MTITAPAAPSTPTSPFSFTSVSAAPAWTQVGPNLWSAIQSTEFLGTVEYTDYAFIACDQVGSVIGTYPTLDDAQQQVLHPTGRAYLARHHISTLLPVAPRTLHARATAAVLGLTAATVSAVSLMIGIHA